MSNSREGTLFATSEGRKKVAEHFQKHFSTDTKNSTPPNAENKNITDKIIANEEAIDRRLNSLFATATSEETKEEKEEKIKEKSTTPGLLTGNNPFSKAIEQLNLLADLRKGIISRYETHTIDGEAHRVLYRDAREQKTPVVYDPTAYEPWAIMGVNYLHAAWKIFELEPDQEFTEQLKNTLKKNALEFLQAMRSSVNPEAALATMIHTNIIPLLMEQYPFKGPDKTASEKQEIVKKMLEEARDFGNFDQATATVITHTKVAVVGEEYRQKHGGYDAYNLDINVPMTGGLTDEQQKQYEALKADTTKNEPELEATIPWYKEQRSPLIRKLIRRHAKDVLAGRMISTQLRKHLAGIRNGGEEFIYASSDKQLEQKLIFSDTHSGNTAHEFNDTRADTESVKQLGKLTDAEHVVVLDLTTDLPIKGLEGGKLLGLLGKKSVNPRTAAAVKKAAKESKELKESQTKYHHSSLTAHQSRSFVPNSYTGVDFIRKQAAQVVASLINETKRPSSIQSPDKTDLPDRIKSTLSTISKDDHNTKKLQSLIKQYDQVRKSIGDSLADDENKNLMLASISAQLVYYVNTLCKTTFLTLDEFCKSGKDRGGLLRLVMNRDAMSMFIADSADSKHAAKIAGLDKSELAQRHQVSIALTASNQIGFEAGMTGNVLGTFGTLASVEWALPDDLNPSKHSDISPIHAPTASYGKHIPKNPNENSILTWKNVGIFFGIALGAALTISGVGAMFGVPILAAIGVATAGAVIGIPSLASSYYALKGFMRTGVATLKQPRVWLSLGMAALGAALCITGIGAIIGAPLIAASATVALATAGGAAIAGSIGLSAISTKSASKQQDNSKYIFAIGITLVGAALCATGVGAAVGAPLIFASTFMLAAGSTLLALSPIKTLYNKGKQAKTAGEKAKYYGAIAGTVILAAAATLLCLSGIGAMAGIPALKALGFLSSATANSAVTSSATIATSANSIAPASVAGAITIGTFATATYAAGYYLYQRIKRTSNPKNSTGRHDLDKLDTTTSASPSSYATIISEFTKKSLQTSQSHPGSPSTNSFTTTSVDSVDSFATSLVGSPDSTHTSAPESSQSQNINRLPQLKPSKNSTTDIQDSPAPPTPSGPK
jgi:hypothetical protein